MATWIRIDSCDNGYITETSDGDKNVHTVFGDVIAHLEEELEIDNDQRILTKRTTDEILT
jgi:hypothetical protein